MMGKTEPRIWTPPLRELTPDTSLGFACIEYATDVLKKTLYPWQKWALIHAMEIVGELCGEWKFRFRTVLFLISRQNGKTVLSEVIASFFLNVLCVDSVFGTSLSLDKAEEVWEAVVKDQEDNPILSAELDKVGRTNGSKKLVLTGLRTYKVGAPTRRAGRGDSNDLVMLDEVREQRDWEAWSAAAASTVAKPNGMIICFSNAGDPDSVVLRQLRESAISAIEGKDMSGDYGGEVDTDTLGLFEWSAEDGAPTDDIEQLAQANPALGYGYLTERALMANRKTYPESKFRAEHMCQQVETILPSPFPDGAWNAGLDTRSFIAPESDLFYGLDLSADRRYASIGVCGMRTDGNYHIELVARRIGTAWVEDWFRARAYKTPMRLAFQSRGAPVSGLAEQICALHGVERIAIEGSDLTAGWGRFYDGIIANGDESRGGIRIYHLDQPVMDTPAKTMQLRNIGGGIELPDRTKSPDDIAPLFACFMAFTAATKIQKEEKKIYASAYAAGAQVVFV